MDGCFLTHLTVIEQEAGAGEEKGRSSSPDSDSQGRAGADKVSKVSKAHRRRATRACDPGEFIHAERGRRNLHIRTHGAADDGFPAVRQLLILDKCYV